jgi:ABC-type phosphate transport system permease subunit
MQMVCVRKGAGDASPGLAAGFVLENITNNKNMEKEQNSNFDEIWENKPKPVQNKSGLNDILNGTLWLIIIIGIFGFLAVVGVKLFIKFMGWLF